MQTNYKKQQKSGRYQSRTPQNSEYPNNEDKQMDTRPFLHNQIRKPLYASSMFSSKEKKKQPAVIRRTFTIDLETKSLKDLDQRGNSIRTRNFLNRKDEELQQGLESQYNYNQNLVRLKIEEMIFKFKTRIGTLLKEMTISVAELNRFTGLSRIDDIIDFLSEKVKEMMMSRDIRSTEIANVRSKDQEMLNEYEVQIEALKKKQQDRENAEKGYKERLKEAHGQIRQLYDRINRRQKELSSKMTEIYQAKAIASESEKVVETLKEKCLNLTKECASLRESNCTQNKKIFITMKNLQDQNISLKEKNEELSELVIRYEEKEKRMIDLNRQLNEELQRWRERFETHRNVPDEVLRYSESTTDKGIKTAQSIEIKEGSPLEGGKHSELTLLNQNSRLTIRTMELQKQNRQLSREYAKYTSLKEKYTELLTYLNSEKSLNNPSQIISPDISDNKSKLGLTFQIEFAYKKKIQENAKQWREKLIEIVNTYEQQAEKSRQEISDLIRQNEQLKGEVQELAIKKYKIENELIEKEREIYQLNRPKRERQSSRVISSLQISERKAEQVEKGECLETEINGGEKAEEMRVQETEQKGIDETGGKEEEKTLLIEKKTAIVDGKQEE